jgi:uncharacterized protein YkwD
VRSPERVSTFARVHRGIRVRQPILSAVFVFDAPRLLLAFVLAACVIVVLPAASADAGKRKRSGECANTGLQPAPGNLGAVRAAVLCLHNRERAAHGLPALRENGKLRQAAKGHSGDMVAHGFFAHDSPSGADMADRILGTGYARGEGWSLGENIAWGTGSLATAAEIQRAWMSSPGHRENILRREFREIGIGIAVGAPVGGGGLDGATYTADFGVRR